LQLIVAEVVVVDLDPAPAFASVGEAMEMARAALGYLARVDAAQLAAQTQVECLRGLERTDAAATAARASFLSAFTVGKGYSADADYSARAWLMHRTGITRGAAASVWNKEQDKVLHSHGPPARPRGGPA
jgi:hypothetical protein